jgi:hypothetical protein
MGWVSYFEDNLERLQERINSAETSLKDGATNSEIRLQKALSAVIEAKGLLAVAQKYLDLATQPELDLAFELNEVKRRSSQLEAELAAANSKIEKLKDQAAIQAVRAEASKKHVSELDKEKRRAERKCDAMARSNFAAAVDVYSSPGMIKKHKPNA